MLYFLEAVTTGATNDAGGGLVSMLLPLVLVIGIFYFMLIRPENKRKKEAEELRSSLKEGDEITTIGGIVGTVVSVKEDKFVIETSADQVRRFLPMIPLPQQQKKRLQRRLKQKQRPRRQKKHKKRRIWINSILKPLKGLTFERFHNCYALFG